MAGPLTWCGWFRTRGCRRRAAGWRSGCPSLQGQRIRSCSSGTSFDLGEILVGELEARRREDRVDLVGVPKTDDRAVYGRVSQRPRDGDRAGGRSVTLGDRREPLHECQMGGELWLQEP